MDAAAWAIVLAVVAAAVALVCMARRRAWNADGSDDERRVPRPPQDEADEPRP
jgi:hypothetical protein